MCAVCAKLGPCTVEQAPFFCVFHLLIHHRNPNTYHLISAHMAHSTIRGIDTVVKLGKHLLLQEYLDEEVS